MLYITRKFHFSASHKVSIASWSNEENLRVFGKCANPNGHGHNYIMEVTVAGKADAVTGYVMDLKELNRIVEDELIEKIDHKNLNVDVDFLKDINPTTENLAIAFWNEIEKHINNDKRKLHSLRLFETEKNSVEYRG